jgi:hypothetical protein
MTNATNKSYCFRTENYVTDETWDTYADSFYEAVKIVCRQFRESLDPDLPIEDERNFAAVTVWDPDGKPMPCIQIHPSMGINGEIYIRFDVGRDAPRFWLRGDGTPARCGRVVDRSGNVVG